MWIIPFYPGVWNYRTLHLLMKRNNAVLHKFLWILGSVPASYGVRLKSIYISFNICMFWVSSMQDTSTKDWRNDIFCFTIKHYNERGVRLLEMFLWDKVYFCLRCKKGCFRRTCNTVIINLTYLSKGNPCHHQPRKYFYIVYYSNRSWSETKAQL